MVTTCCCCLDLYKGSVCLGTARLVHWVTILLASIYVAVHIFSPDGVLIHQARVDIEQNSKRN